MANFNYSRIIIGGRLATDPELRSTNAGKLCTNFSVAVNRAPDKTGERKVDYFDCTAWGERANFITKWFSKGSSICVSGRAQIKEWESNSGTKHKTAEIIVDEVAFVDSKDEIERAETPAVPQTVAPKFVDINPDDENLPF